MLAQGVGKGSCQLSLLLIAAFLEEPKITLGVLLQEPPHGSEILRGQHFGQVVEAERASVGHDLALNDVSQVKEVSPSIEDCSDLALQVADSP